MGLKVTDTASPMEAKEFFDKRDIGLVIIHLKAMPLRALELCRLLRAESTVPILMLTNRSEVIDDVMVMSAGADDYVSKPINNKILVARVNQQIARGQSQRAPRATPPLNHFAKKPNRTLWFLVTPHPIKRKLFCWVWFEDPVLNHFRE